MKDEIGLLLPVSYRNLRSSRQWPDVGLTIYPLDEIEEGQIGYRFDPNGISLIGAGDRWRHNWIVIGHDNLSGDPIFIDIEGVDIPVFTSAHGQGSWESDLIAKSAVVFFDSLNVVDSVQRGALPLRSGLARIAEENANSDIDLEFWSLLLGAC